MKNLIAIILLLFITITCYAQQVILSPHPVENGTRFSFSLEQIKKSTRAEFKRLEDIEITSVAVAGSFNQWKKNEHLMFYDTDNKIWYVDIKLKPGVEYHYKFVINDSIWITDPNAPDVTEDEWRNGILIPVDFSSPYVIDVNPPYGKRLTKLIPFTCKLISNEGKVLPNSIKVFLNDKPVKYKYDQNNQTLRVDLPRDLKEGEHKILIQFEDDKGKRNEGFLTKFFLDRYKAKIRTPDFYNSAIVYEIFIRTFNDSDGDGIGDFRGLTDKLDYLKDLGVDVLWLMPFNESSKDHGYNVIDYYAIEKDYGTMEDYLSFLKECKKRNIKVIKDIVINHCDSTFEFFRDAKNNPSSKYSNWFQFTDQFNSEWRHFGIEKDMPKFNFENNEVQNYFIKFVKYWMDPNGDGKFDDGIDGVRCDAAKEIPHQIWNRFRKELKKIRPDFLILGEVWDGANYLIPFFEDEFDMLFDYPIYYALQRFFDGSDINSIKNTIIHQREIYPPDFQMLRFLSNHDNHRALSLFDQDTMKYYQALVLLFTLPGTPMIYYGDEIGLIGKTPPENVRQKMKWDLFENNLIYLLHKELIRIRKTNKTFSKNDDAKIQSIKFLKSNYQEVLSFVRYDENGEYLVIINSSEQLIKGISFSDYNLKNKTGLVIFVLSDFLIGNTRKFEMNLENLILKPKESIIVKLKDCKSKKS